MTTKANLRQSSGRRPTVAASPESLNPRSRSPDNHPPQFNIQHSAFRIQAPSPNHSIPDLSAFSTPPGALDRSPRALYGVDAEPYPLRMPTSETVRSAPAPQQPPSGLRNQGPEITAPSASSGVTDRTPASASHVEFAPGMDVIPNGQDRTRPRPGTTRNPGPTTGRNCRPRHKAATGCGESPCPPHRKNEAVLRRPIFPTDAAANAVFALNRAQEK